MGKLLKIKHIIDNPTKSRLRIKISYSIAKKPKGVFLTPLIFNSVINLPKFL